MNLLVTDAFCSANRGDAAILDGIVSGLRARLPGAAVRVTSRFPALATRFHDVEAVDDRDVVAVQRELDRADLVIGCGGSYLHDLYALNLHPRLATLHAAARAGKRFVVYAQSIGPLDSALSRTAARNVLDEATWILVRDEASERVVASLGVRAPLALGVDAAVSGRASPVARSSGRPVLGVTVRSWHFPGLADPARLQEAYEAEVARACDAWAAKTGGIVRFLSNCTSLGGYAQDDRVPARRVAARMRAQAEVVEAEDPSFAEVRGQAGATDFFLGTRMHSLVFATTAGVPGVGVGYEQKTAEWLDQVGLGGRLRPIEAPEGLTAELLKGWDEREALAGRLRERIPALRAQAEAQLDQLAEIAQGAAPAARRGRAYGTASWNEETWKYDRAHRRLRVVADTVLGEVTHGRVLDLGCSSGLLGRMLGPAFDYTGLDLAPSVAIEEPRFRIRTAALDGDWPVEGPFDVVLASGALEYVADVPGVLARARALLAPGGLAVVTLFNLAHGSRGPSARRHPTWKFDLRPDEFAMALAEAGLAPLRILPSSAGRAPAPAVDHEVPTDLDRAGAVQLAMPQLVRLAHHVVVVCRAAAPVPGPAAVEATAGRGELFEATKVALALCRRWPWSARAWADLAVLAFRAGELDQARSCFARAAALDPSRPGLAEDAAAVDRAALQGVAG